MLGLGVAVCDLLERRAGVAKQIHHSPDHIDMTLSGKQRFVVTPVTKHVRQSFLAVGNDFNG